MPRSSSSSSRSSSRSSYSKPSYSGSSYSSTSRPNHSTVTSRSSYSSPSKPVTSTPSVAPISQTQPSTVHHKVEQPGFFSNVMQGFAWGTGTSIARNIFESKPTVVPAPSVASPSVTSNTSTTINDCREYDLCKKLDDPYECFAKLDQNLYNKCHKD
jgi:hypothetical protein